MMRAIMLKTKTKTINKMSDSGNTLLAAIVGSAIGAALGILYAPDKGEVTRRKIADQAASTRDQLVDSAGEMRDRVASSVATQKESLESRAESLVSDVSYKTDDIISTLERKLSELKAKNKKLQKTS